MRLKGRRRIVLPAKPEAPPTPAKPKTLDLDEVWGEATTLYANKRALRLSRSWFTKGMAERAGGDRLSVMRRRPGAKRVAHLLEGLSDPDLRVFHARAAINLEQAVAATRLTVLYNISVPLGVVLLVNELAPNLVALVFADSGPAVTGAAWSGLLALLGLVFLAIWFCFAGVHQARDLYHLATLAMARRGLAATLGGGEANPADARP